MIKNIFLIPTLALCSGSVFAADTWNLALGADYWHTSSDANIHNRTYESASSTNSWDRKLNYHILFEHGIYLLPNAKLEFTEFNSRSDMDHLKQTDQVYAISANAYDATLYYRIFNNTLFQIDLGLTGRRYTSDYSADVRNGTSFVNGSYSKNMVMAYTGAELRIPTTTLSAFGNVQTRDKNNIDYRLGLAYKMPSLPIKFSAGWRDIQFNSGPLEQHIDGWFMGAQYTF